MNQPIRPRARTLIGPEPSIGASWSTVPNNSKPPSAEDALIVAAQRLLTLYLAKEIDATLVDGLIKLLDGPQQRGAATRARGSGLKIPAATGCSAAIEDLRDHLRHPFADAAGMREVAPVDDFPCWKISTLVPNKTVHPTSGQLMALAQDEGGQRLGFSLQLHRGALCRRLLPG